MDPRARKEEKAATKGDKKGAPEMKTYIPPNPGKKGGCGYATIGINKFPKYIATAYEPKEKDDKKGKKDSKDKGPPTWKPTSPGNYFDPKPFRTPGKFVKTYNEVNPAPPTTPNYIPPSPTKWLGGCMGGCFSKWPKYIATTYVDPWKLEKYQEAMLAKKAQAKSKGAPSQKTDKAVPKFIPPSCNKTYPIYSVMNKNALLSTNNVTWRSIKPLTFTREFI